MLKETIQKKIPHNPYISRLPRYTGKNASRNFYSTPECFEAQAVSVTKVKGAHKKITICTGQMQVVYSYAACFPAPRIEMQSHSYNSLCLS